MAQPRPYIGVTGFTSASEVSHALVYVPPHAKRDFMVGVLASYKSVRGERLSARWAPQFPRIEDLASVFPEYPRDKYLLPLVHYSGDDDHLLEDMLGIVARVRHKLGGLQLNMLWPAPSILEAFHNHMRADRYRVARGSPLNRRRIVLQINHAAIEAAGGTPAGVIAHIAMYRGLVDYFLLDASGGEGRLFDVGWAKPYIALFYDADLPFQYGVAGGLGVRSMEPVRKLLAEFPDLSWDAQGRLRNTANELDLEAVTSYLDQSFALVR